MPKYTITLAAMITLLAACSGSGATDPSARDLGPNFAQTTPGTPGEANCKGQTTAFFAQASKNALIPEGFRGIGGVARFADLSVKEVKAAIDAFCTVP